MNSLFTHRDNIESKVGIGKLPNELQYILDDDGREREKKECIASYYKWWSQFEYY